MPQDRPQDYTLPERDVNSRIQEIIAGMSQPEPEPGFWMRLFQAIPQAISVGVSQDPGAAFERHIATRFQQIQIEKQRKQRLKELGATIEIEGLLERDRESRREAAENRRFERESKQKEKEFASASKEQRFQLGLQNRFQKSRDLFQANETRLRDARQNRFSKELEEARIKATADNQRILEIAKPAIDAIMSGEMDETTAVELFGRIANGETPNKQDIANMNKAIKSQQAKVQRMALERIRAEGVARGGGTSPEEARIRFALEYAKQNPMIWITDVDGQQKLIKREVDPLMEKPAIIAGQKFIREATLEEVHDYALKSIPRAIIPIPNSENKIGHAEGLVREASKTRDFNAVKTDFLKPEIYGALQLTKGEADSIIQKIEAETKGQPPPLPATLDETEAELKEIEQELRTLTSPTPGRAVAVPRSLSKEDKETVRQLREREVAIKERKQKQATVKYIEDRLNVAKAELQSARTQARRERLEKEVTDLESRLKVARESANK